jgi:hypothetical protein
MEDPSQNWFLRNQIKSLVVKNIAVTIPQEGSSNG